MRRSGFVLGFLVFLSACATGGGVAVGPNGEPLARLYRINASDTSRVQFSLMDGMNSLRQVSGVGPVQLNAQLNAAAATHARDMAIQNRPWHFGSDGSSPIDRIRRVGYTGVLIGENISETYESERETLAAWMEDPNTRRVILNPQANDLGFAWFQEQNGKIWWTLITGSQSTQESDLQG
ncbi:MAG: CAP domain-containing protein [Pseudomonadota bacterium]